MRVHDKLIKQPLETLIPYARNSRTHSEAQVAQVAASIREFGFTSPVLIDERGGIIAGHGRVLAARKLGMAEVPCLVLEGLTEPQKRAYVIADNRLAELAGWDQDMLAIELEDLRLEDYDIDLTGFDAGALEQIFGGDVDALEDMPGLPDGDREPFQQMTFTLHDEQVNTIKSAINRAKALGPFHTPNENGNGNALDRICETYLRDHA